MILVDPNMRRDIKNISILIKRATRLIHKEFTPVGKNEPQPCTYCGYGKYVFKVNNNQQVRNFGFTPIGGSDWRVLVCNECGHTQAFRVDYANNKSWWSWNTISFIYILIINIFLKHILAGKNQYCIFTVKQFEFLCLFLIALSSLSRKNNEFNIIEQMKIWQY